MAYNKKYAELGESVIDYVNDREDAIEEGFDDVEKSIKLTTNRFYEKTYTTTSAGNANTNFPLIDNTVVVYNLIDVNVSSSDKYRYSLGQIFINDILYFRLFRDGVPAPNTEFTVRFVAIKTINID